MEVFSSELFLKDVLTGNEVIDNIIKELKCIELDGTEVKELEGIKYIPISLSAGCNTGRFLVKDNWIKEM